MRNGILALLLLLLSACTLEKRDSSQIHIEIGQKPGPSQALLAEWPDLIRDELGIRAAAPSSFNDFECLAVNVMGPGIPSRPGDDLAGREAEIYNNVRSGTSYCSYPGVVSGAVFRNGSSFTQGSFDVQVPSGPQRLVQVLALTDLDKCRSLPAGEGGQSPTIFHVGSAVVDTFQDADVGITSDWGSLTTAQQQLRGVECDPLETCATAGSVGLGGGGLPKNFTFTPGSSGQLSYVTFPLSVTTGQQGTAQAALYSGSCAGTLITTSTNSTLLGTGSAKDHTFRLQAALNGGTTYCVEVTGTANVSGGTGTGLAVTCN